MPHFKSKFMSETVLSVKTASAIPVTNSYDLNPPTFTHISLPGSQGYWITCNLSEVTGQFKQLIWPCFCPLILGEITTTMFQTCLLPLPSDFSDKEHGRN